MVTPVRAGTWRASRAPSSDGSSEHGFDVFAAVAGGVGAEIAWPMLVVLTLAEPFFRFGFDGRDDFGLHLAMPRQDVLGWTVAPLLVDQRVDAAHVHTAQGGRALFTA